MLVEPVLLLFGSSTMDVLIGNAGDTAKGTAFLERESSAAEIVENDKELLFDRTLRC